nr:MAG TPA: hypothetical protein [Caudoviricetes sp.]
MMLHIPEFRAMAVCNQHLDHGAFDIDLGPDVVKVVRCKDCANSEVTDRGKRYCSAPLGTYGAVPVNDNDFCSHWR